MNKNWLITYKTILVKYMEDAVSIINKLLSVDLRKINILHLDDHLLYSNGVTNCILKKFPNAIFKCIQNGDQALEYVSNCIDNNKPIDLIITDFNHPGLNGLEFAYAVRKTEKISTKRIPILFITLVDNKSLKINIEKIPFSKYLCKIAYCTEINSAIENLI